MGARRRLLTLIASIATATLSAGGAWAASGHSGPFTGLRPSVSADSSDSSSTSSPAEVTDPPSSSTSSTTDTTEVDETTTSSVEPETSTSEPKTSPTTPTGCKPGWGYGDKNHC